MTTSTFRFFTVFSAVCGAALLSQCDKKPAAPSQTATYECADIGWTINYPDDWNVLNDAEIAEIEGNAQPAMEEVIGGELEISHRNLLYLRKNQFNAFTSTMDRHDVGEDGPYEETQTVVFDVLLESYRVSDLEIEHEFGSATIDGLPFKTLAIKIYKPGTKDVLIDQMIYDRMFENGQTLLLSTTWNDTDERKLMEEMLNSSRFTVR